MPVPTTMLMISYAYVYLNNLLYCYYISEVTVGNLSKRMDGDPD
jgi:hypothetical protein